MAERAPYTAVYKPDQNRGWGISVWITMFRQLVASRELIWRLFVRDFSARYRQSLLGVLWAVLLPVFAVGTFMVLNASGVLDVGSTEAPYPAWALLNLTVWQVFAAGLAATTGSIVAGGSMVVKINFPKSALVMASLGNVLVETGIRLVMIVGVFAWYGVTPKATAFLAPLVLVPVLALTLGLGLVLSLFNALLRDVIHVVTVGVTFLLFVTPVLYADPGQGLLSRFNTVNPMAIFVDAARELVLVGGLEDPGRFLWFTTAAVALFLVAWRLFNLVEPRMVERV
jgi:lipopolysaccharide transport system permease protein